MGLRTISRLEAVTLDDFFTLRYPIKEKEDIIYPILKALKKEAVNLDDEKFLKQYSREDGLYRKRLKETLRESLLDDIVSSALMKCGYESRSVVGIVREAVNRALATRKAKWFPGAKETLVTLRKKSYKLGLISNTHWRISGNLRKEFENLFDVITLSYEHGYAKPHPSIFIVTSGKLGVDANQCLHVGDDPIADIQGARSAGMKAAFVGKKEIRTIADIGIRRITELAALL